MARVALALAGAVAGGLIGFAAAGPAGIAYGVEEGASVGIAVGGILFPPKSGRPPLQDFQVSGSAQGAPVPFGYGLCRVPGQLIWTPGITLTIKQHSSLGTGNPIYEYWASFAAAFGEGPAIFNRIWGDSKLIYDANPLQSATDPTDFPPWSATQLYNPGNEVSFNSLVYQCLETNTGVAPNTPGTTDWLVVSQYPPWNNTTDYNPGDLVTATGTLAGVTYYIWVSVRPSGPDSTEGVVQPGTNDNYWYPIQAWYGIPTMYPGTQTQTPDPQIQGSQSAALTPAFRGMCYAKWDTFPLANFGNRIPNLRAEVNYVKVRNIL